MLRLDDADSSERHARACRRRARRCEARPPAAARYGANRRPGRACDLAGRNARRADRYRPGRRASQIHQPPPAGRHAHRSKPHTGARRRRRGAALVARRKPFGIFGPRRQGGLSAALRPRVQRGVASAESGRGRGQRRRLESRRTAHRLRRGRSSGSRPVLFCRRQRLYRDRAHPAQPPLGGLCGGRRTAAPNRRLLDDRANRSGRHLLLADRVVG